MGTVDGKVASSPILGSLGLPQRHFNVKPPTTSPFTYSPYVFEQPPVSPFNRLDPAVSHTIKTLSCSGAWFEV